MDKNKICRRCKCFGPHRPKPCRKTGHMCYCRKCEADIFKQKYAKAKIEFINLLGGKCSQCGLQDHYCVYDFHHIDPSEKTSEVFRMPKHLQMQEMMKCKLLCGICHRKHGISKQTTEPIGTHKTCKICGNFALHRIKISKNRPTTQKDREAINQNDKNQMRIHWHTGEKIHNLRQTKKWKKHEWENVCQRIFGFGTRNASDYERLFLNYSIDNVPRSLNSVRKKCDEPTLNVSKRYYEHQCVDCRRKKSKIRCRNVKLQAVEYLGGKCKICDLSDEPSVYDFHHTDPQQKDFNISRKQSTFKSIKNELDKCVLLCCHCHRKLHVGLLFIDPLTF